MGSSRTPGEFARKFERAAHAVDTAQRAAVNQGAEVVSDVLFREAMRSIGGTQLAGAKWGTRVQKATAVRNPTALISYKGPVHWFERGTGPHTIVSRKVGGSKHSRGDFDLGEGMFDGRARGAIRTPRGIRAYANPRGMKARPFFDRAKNQSREPAAREIRRALIERPLRSIF
jgi:hypothetical protein